MKEEIDIDQREIKQKQWNELEIERKEGLKLYNKYKDSFKQEELTTLDEIQESNGISNQYGFHLKNNIWN
jgi:hypothetical protein